MLQTQFDTLLTWLMVSAQNTAVLVEQNQLGRPLTEEEFSSCYKRAHTAAVTMTNFLEENRRKT